MITLKQVTVALNDERFGVLCDPGVQEIFKKKLDEEYRQFRILYACNPALSHEAFLRCSSR
jgi:uncharacterized protein (DUF302 family)